MKSATTTVQNYSSVACESLISFLDEAESVNIKSIIRGAIRVGHQVLKAAVETMAALLIVSVVVLAKVVNPVRRAIIWGRKNLDTLPHIYRVQLRVLNYAMGWMDRHPRLTTAVLVIEAAAFVLEVFMYA